MSVIIGRALPDVRDGLKPVHRRILFAMHELGNAYNRAYKKSRRASSATSSASTTRTATSAVYDALVRMAQDFSHALPAGGWAGQLRLASTAIRRPPCVTPKCAWPRWHRELLADIDKETVDFGPNYDESLQEPLVLPARVPNLLVNGSSGIAVGMATNIPPHNLGEVIDATRGLGAQPQA